VSPAPVRTPGLRGLILAAGLGTRLRPLTDTFPKPLLPIAGKPLLAYTLERLAAAGCDAVAINLHHGGELIRAHFGDSYEGMPLTWSVEPQLLGTLGALYQLRSFFASAEVILVINGDSLCHWPLGELAARHRERGATATLLLASRPNPAEFGGGVAVDRAGRILSFRPLAPAAEASGGAEAGPRERRWVFAGAHALAPRLLARVASHAARGAPSATSSDIVRDLYEPLLVERPGSLAALTTTRRWHDMGTPRRFLAGTLEWLPAAHRGAAPRWIAPGAAVEAGVTVRRSSLEAACRIGEGAWIEDSVVLNGAEVGSRSVVRRSILGPGVVLPAGSEVVGRLVAGGATIPLGPLGAPPDQAQAPRRRPR
jgi:NDP-sugar pyrophosphorylase family protein